MSKRTAKKATPPSPAAALEEAGQALYGPEWLNPFARALGIDNRMLRRWKSGEWAFDLTDPRNRELMRRTWDILETERKAAEARRKATAAAAKRIAAMIAPDALG